MSTAREWLERLVRIEVAEMNFNLSEGDGAMMMCDALAPELEKLVERVAVELADETGQPGLLAAARRAAFTEES